MGNMVVDVEVVEGKRLVGVGVKVGNMFAKDEILRKEKPV